MSILGHFESSCLLQGIPFLLSLLIIIFYLGNALIPLAQLLVIFLVDCRSV